MPSAGHHTCEDNSSRIAVLERDMLSLLGNGQPGRVKEIENAVKLLFRYLYIGLGVVATMQFLAGSGTFSWKHLFSGG